MLRLQNGKFDAPDRMFHSIADTWNNAVALPADVKEVPNNAFNYSSSFVDDVQTAHPRILHHVGFSGQP